MKHVNQKLKKSAWVVFKACSVAIMASMFSCQPQPGGGFPNFPATLSSDVPKDVDIAFKDSLDSKQEFAKVQRMFDILSWQSFLAASWPVDANGNAKANLTDAGAPRWVAWKESYEVYKEDGSQPSAWGSPRDLPGAPSSDHPEIPGVANFDKNTRILYLNNKTKNVLDEELQAFTGPLWDQNGNLVRYEVLMNKDEFDYVVDNTFYNLDGQIEFSKTHQAANFPSGKFGGDTVGAIELELAWKVIDESKGDVAGRFYTMDAYVLNEEETAWVKQKMGLVAMHISHKTISSPQWIWSTFEHVDNVQVDDLEEVNGKKLKPSFNNPDCETCPVNVVPDTTTKTKTNPLGYIKAITQVMRVVPIPEATQALNHQVQQLLKSKGSVWQYYELINTQWPTDPTAKPTPPGHLPGSIDNKAGGKPTPVYLTNMTMETYFQKGNQPAGQQEEGQPKDATTVFGTESCVGCHSSAGIATGFTMKDGQKKPKFGGQLSADFSWLPSQKAHWKKQ